MGPFYFPNPDILKASYSADIDKYGFQLPYPLVDSGNLKKFLKTYLDKLQYRESQWRKLLMDYDNIPPGRCEKVKRYIRKGIPCNLRGKMWFYYSGAEAVWIANQGLYADLISRLDKSCFQTDFTEEINKDLHRTFPNNIHFKTERSADNEQEFQVNNQPILSALRRVLLCLSLHRPDVGYCQAFSYIVGVLLLFIDEEKAFWMLYVIIEEILPKKIYQKGMEGATMEVRVLMTLIKSRMPTLWNHLTSREELGMPPPNLAITHWFPLLFADLLPIESTLRVWDSFFYEGPKVLFRTSLALFQLFENELLSISDPLMLFQSIQNMPKRAYDCHNLMEIAFSRSCSLARSDLNYQREIASRQP